MPLLRPPTTKNSLTLPKTTKTMANARESKISEFYSGMPTALILTRTSPANKKPAAYVSLLFPRAQLSPALLEKQWKLSDQPARYEVAR